MLYGEMFILTHNKTRTANSLWEAIRFIEQAHSNLNDFIE